MRRKLRDRSIVLERRPLGEADWLTTLLCQEQGKLAAVAPSARRSRRRFGGCLDLFCLISVELTDKGRGGLWRLEEAQLVDAFPGIRTDLVAIAHAGYLTELSSALLREGELAGEAFVLLAQALSRLNDGPLRASDLRRFEFALLDLSGFAPQLDGCTRCATTQSAAWFFDYDQGGLVCENCERSQHAAALPLDLLQALRGLRSGDSSRLTRTSMALAREVLARLIDQQVGRPLKAREFLKKLAIDGATKSNLQ
jgi:DNA repair protein RecO (recombination protein O)